MHPRRSHAGWQSALSLTLLATCTISAHAAGPAALAAAATTDPSYFGASGERTVAPSGETISTYRSTWRAAAGPGWRADLVGRARALPSDDPRGPVLVDQILQTQLTLSVSDWDLFADGGYRSRGGSAGSVFRDSLMAAVGARHYVGDGITLEVLAEYRLPATSAIAPEVELGASVSYHLGGSTKLQLYGFRVLGGAASPAEVGLTAVMRF
jgi:hypothetical protein